MKHKFNFLFFIQCCFALQLAAHEVSPSNKELHFRENKNQWHENIKFIGFMNAGNIFLENNTITFQLFNGADLKKLHPIKKEDVTIHGHVYRMHFDGANPNPEMKKENPSPEYYNYFIGNNPHKWAGSVKQYQTITYLNLYPNIDFKVYRFGLTMKYEFIVHKGGNTNAIKISYEGTEGMSINNSGSLVIKTSVGDVIEAPPISFQNIDSKKSIVKSEYDLTGTILSFKMNENYSAHNDLIIDPILIFSTFIGSTAENRGYTATYDDAGNLYLGGYVNTIQFGGTYPTTAGSFQLSFGGGTNTSGLDEPCDIVITKFNNTGTSLIYSTYLGGNDNETPHSLYVNSADQLCVYGKTYSANYPTTIGCFDSAYNGDADIVITVFNQTGTALIGSTFIGGAGMDGVNFDPAEMIYGGLKYNYMDDGRGEIICDQLNNIYVASSTLSNDFPATAGAFQIINAGGQDGCIFKLNQTCSSLIYSTYIGGVADDACYSLDKKNDNTIYICGGTMSTDFPSTAATIHPNFIGGYCDGFISNLSADGSTMLSSSFIGTDSLDQVYFVKLDADENVYLIGITEGNYQITIPSGYTGVYSDSLSGQFISKLNSGLDTVIFSTVIGNHNEQPNISITAFGIDSCNNIYLCGWGTSNFVFGHTSDIANLPLTSNAFQTTNDGTDFYIASLSANAQQLNYGSYFGGSGSIEHVDGGTSRFNQNGILYQAICAGCGGNSFTPTTTGVWSNTNNSNNCNELGLVFNVGDIIISSPTATLTTGPLPLIVNFNSGINSGIIHWDFGTGNSSDTSSQYNPSFTFNDTGTFIITVTANNQNSCSSGNTFSIVVHVHCSAIPVASFTPDSLTVPFPANVQFTNTSLNADSYHWNFGTGNPNDTSSNISPAFIFNSPGDYSVQLIAFENSVCHGSDTFTIVVHVFDPTGISELSISYWSVFPNPTKNNFQISNSSHLTFSYELTDVIGRSILKNSSSESVLKIGNTELPAGIYFLKLKNIFQEQTLKLIIIK